MQPSRTNVRLTNATDGRLNDRERPIGPIGSAATSCATRVQSIDQFATAATPIVGEIRAGLQRQGTPMGSYDRLIAGHARSRGLVVVTGNLGEFRRVEGLCCEDWEHP